MSRFTLVFCLLFVLASASVDPTWGLDKLYHVGACGLISSAGCFGAKSLGLNDWQAAGLAIGGTLAIGALKEWHDARTPHSYWSWKDIGADGLGALTGAAVTWGANWLVAKWRR